MIPAVAIAAALLGTDQPVVTIARCQTTPCHRRVRRKRRRRWARKHPWQHRWNHIPGNVKAHLASIAGCESGGDATAVGGGGKYRGRYQFEAGTWASVGGKGDPAAAAPREQDVRAAWLLMRDGPGHWPGCG